MMCLRSRNSLGAGIKGPSMEKRYIFLLSKAMVCSAVNAGTTGKSAGNGSKNARSTKGILMMHKPARAQCAIMAMLGPIRHATSVE